MCYGVWYMTAVKLFGHMIAVLLFLTFLINDSCQIIYHKTIVNNFCHTTATKRFFAAKTFNSSPFIQLRNFYFPKLTYHNLIRVNDVVTTVSRNSCVSCLFNDEIVVLYIFACLFVYLFVKFTQHSWIQVSVSSFVHLRTET